MATTHNSLNPTGPLVKMMPEGSRKICVLNGSRQVDQVLQGNWTTLKVLPENGLPKGIYQLAEATRPDTGKDGKEKNYTGQILQVDSREVYQLQGKGVVKHDRAAFKDLESKGEQLTVGRNYSVGYVNGTATAKQVSASVQAPRSASKGAGQSM